MPTTELIPAPKLQPLDNNGKVVPGGKVFTYAAGTNTKLATYTDSTGNTQNTNPIVLDASGRCDCWLQQGKLYKITFSPATDGDPPTNAFWTVDNVQGAVNSSDVQDGGLMWMTGVTGSNTIAGTTSGTPAALKAGQVVRWIQPTTNTTAVTVNRDATGAKNLLKKSSGGLVALVQSDLIASNEYEATYDGVEYVLQGARPYSQGAAIASAATINLDTATGDYAHITGSTGPVTAITLAQGEERTVVYDSTPTMTNGASLVLVGGSRTVAAGDISVFRGEAAGVVREVNYVHTSVAANLVNAGPSSGAAASPTFRSLVGADGSNAVLVTTLTASNSASLSYTALSSTYDRWVFQCQNLVPAANGASLSVQVGNGSFNNTTYNWVLAGLSGTTYGAYTPTTTEIFVAGNVGNAAGKNFSGDVSVNNPGATGTYKLIVTVGGAVDSAGNDVALFGCGAWQGGTGVIDRIQFTFSGGVIVSGKIYVWGIRNA